MQIIFIQKIKKIIDLSKESFSEYKKSILILSILGFLSGAFEVIGITTLIPLFSAVLGASDSSDSITRYIVEFLNFFGLDFRVRYLLVIILTLFILKAFAIFFSMILRANIISDYEYKERNNLFNLYINSNWRYLSKEKVGYFENSAMNDIRRGSSLLRDVSSILSNSASLIVYIFAAISISSTITMITLGIGASIFFLLKPLFYKIRILAKKTSKKNKDIAHFINENVIGFKSIKSYPSIISQIVVTGDSYFNTLKKLRIKLLVYKGINSIFIEPIGLIFIIILFIFSYATNTFNIASFVIIIYLIQRIFVYIGKFQGGISGTIESMSYLENVIKYKKDTIEFVENISKGTPFYFNNEIEFKNITFSYDEVPILSDLNIKIKKGSMLGIVGSSGSGKTTIADLMLRLYEPNNGNITIDGKNINNISILELRSSIGYVPQDTFLLNDTIENNIRFYNKNLSMEDIVTVAKQAHIAEYIDSLDDDYKTIIGERGTRLSGGQRQRIIIARTLAQKPKILILDEATSALDNESEQKIHEIITEFKGKKTIIIIAHRLSTIVECDKLIVLKDGKIVEKGEPKELLKNKESKFFKLYNIKD